MVWNTGASSPRRGADDPQHLRCGPLLLQRLVALALRTRKFFFKVCIGSLRHRGRPLSPFRRLPLHGGGRLLTRLVEVRLKAYARLGNGSMALGRAVCTGDTINCCDAHLTSAMGHNPNLPHCNSPDRFTSISGHWSLDIGCGPMIWHRWRSA